MNKFYGYLTGLVGYQGHLSDVLQLLLLCMYYYHAYALHVCIQNTEFCNVVEVRKSETLQQQQPLGDGPSRQFNNLILMPYLLTYIE